MKKNESFYFSSQEPHSWSNPGKKKAVVIWVVSPPTFCNREGNGKGRCKNQHVDLNQTVSSF